MRLPFSTEQFLELFRQYNESVGVAPVVLAALAAGAAALAFTRFSWRHRAIAGVLVALWLWSGAVYHWSFFTRINPAAWLFGAAFTAQAALLAAYGVVRNRIRFQPGHNAASVGGVLLIAYALVMYPVLGWALGHGYPAGPSFGVPCPVTIFSLGMMLFAIRTIPVVTVVLPLLWAMVGMSAAMQLGMREDFALGVAALVVIVELARRQLEVRRPHGQFVETTL